MSEPTEESNFKNKINARQAMIARLERIATSNLNGMLSNEAWNSPQAQKYLEMKELTLERLAAESAIALIIEVEKVVDNSLSQKNSPPTLVPE